MREKTMRATETRTVPLPSRVSLAHRVRPFILPSLSSACYQATESREQDKNRGDRFADIFEMLKFNDEEASNPVARHFNLPNYSGQDIRNHGSLQSLYIKVGGLGRAERMAVQFARSFVHA